MQKITTKAKNYKLLLSGKFGNTLASFATIKEALNSNCKSIGFRYSDRSINGKNFFALVDKDKALQTYNDFLRKGAEEDKLKIGEGDKHVKHKLLIQGEIGYINGTLELAYSKIPNITNREASRRGYKRVVGLTAIEMLKYYLWPVDYEWLRELLDNYLDHIIEFSTFSCAVGNIPNRNTVIWEVRKY